MTHYLIRPDTAFSVQRQRRPREKNNGHLAWIRTLPCVVCLSYANSDPAHIRSASSKHGKRQTGMAEKPDDRWVTPLCREHHDAQHARGDELAWWAENRIDPFSLALALYGASGDDELAMQIINEARDV